MKAKSTITLFAAGLVSLAVFNVPAQAEPNRWNHFPRHDVRPVVARHEIRQDWRELHKDRAELARDQAELGRDRADLRNLYRSHASRGAIDGKRAEIRQDVREIYQDRREIRDDYAELRRDRGNFGSGTNGRFGDRRDWNRQDNGRWGRGWDYGRD
ncbi:MAG: hypothetical protein EXR70_24480 [Deltaproteobacteria bacterium]|nr:hypothetical protein [Deltaproteobacteria bacterium]